ncbi:MAG TPA: AAA family ATPase [Bacteroidia bacterium]|nr:AAA family ATPase [Bacteroidia bacterium]
MENYIENPETLIFKDAKENDAQKSARLFDNFWHQGELAVFFGNQQSGKSLLAVQIAEAISAGKAPEGFKLDAAPQKVLYFDFDKTGYHFSQRYKGYQFNPNFRRLVVNKTNLDFKHLAEQFFFGVEELMCEEGAEVVIFDSLPVIKCFVKDSYFLKGIQRLKEYSDVSILLVGETKKEIKGKPLRLNHLDAHKQLMGFADSVFAMGHASGEANERYLIHLKSGDKRFYNKENVITGRITPSVGRPGQAVTGVTPVTPFLPGFSVTKYSTESYVISPPEGLELEILTLKCQQPELSLGQIAKELKINKMKVKRVLERYEVKFETLNSKSEKLNSIPGHNKTSPVSSSFNEQKVKKLSSPNPFLSPAVSAQGGMPNAGPGLETVEPLLSDPSRGDVEPSGQPSHRGVVPKLSFSQRLKKQIAQKNMERMKAR